MALPHPDPGWSNQLLAKLPPRVRKSFLEKGREQEFEVGDVICEEAASLDKVYFPVDCVVSQLSPGTNPAVEVALVGHEGMLGSIVGLGMAICMLRTTIQHGGRALVVPAKVFADHFQKTPELRRLVGAYLAYQGTQMARTAYCNRFHEVEERLARWLLMMADRARSPRYRTTHEFLSIMLGTRRAGVSVAANALRLRGLLRYQRGMVEILDRTGLEKQACSCYRYSAEAYDKLFH